MNDIISSEERDAVFRDLIKQNNNNVCFDCNSKNPKWASVNLALFICFDCSGRHRSYGTNISFVRSIDLDKWKRVQLEKMKLGGNAKAKATFKEYGVDYEDKFINYKNSKVDKYREELTKQAEKSLEMYVIANNSNSNGNTNTNTINGVNSAITENGSKTNNKDIFDNFDDFSIKDKDKTEKKDRLKESVAVDLSTESKENKSTKKKKQGKVETLDNFDFDWDDNAFSKKPAVTVTSQENQEKAKVSRKTDSSDEDEGNKVTYSKNLKSGSSYGNSNSYGSINHGNYGIDNGNNNSNSIESTVDSKKFDNRKAISSDDYANSNGDPKWIQNEKNARLKSMKNATAIGSADINGEEPEEESLGDKLKGYAYNFSMFATDKAKELKEKSKQVINKIQEKYGS